MSEPSVGEPVTQPVGAPEPPKRRKQRSSTRNMVEWALVIVGAILVAFIVKTFLIQAFQIPSASMHPTLLEGDRVLVNKLSYDLHDVNRGDVVVFARPKGMNAGPNDPDDLIKRVIGLPGDSVQTKDGKVYVDGRELDEPYLADGTVTDGIDDPITIPDGHVWVMGDNRGDSQDSRVFGPIDTDTIVGRAFMVMWPPSRMGSL
jgi:signal peptidase I